MAITLTGSLVGITNQPIDSITRATVKAPSHAVGSGGQIITTQPEPVTIGEDGDVAITVEPGLGWLYLEGDGWTDSIRFVAAEGMTSLIEAVLNALPAPFNAAWLLELYGSASRLQELYDGLDQRAADWDAQIDAFMEEARAAWQAAQDQAVRDAADKIAVALQDQAVIDAVSWSRGELTDGSLPATMFNQEHQGKWGLLARVAQDAQLPEPGAGVLLVYWASGRDSYATAVQEWQSGRSANRWFRTKYSGDDGYGPWSKIGIDLADPLLKENLWWDRGLITDPTVVDGLRLESDAGVWRMEKGMAQRAGMPEPDYGVLTVKHVRGITGYAYALQTWESILTGARWVRSKARDGEWSQWSNPGGSTAAGGQPATASAAMAVREELAESRGGRIGTAGRGVVALRFDHNIGAFKDTLLPLLKARGLPASQCHFPGQLEDWYSSTDEDSKASGYGWQDVDQYFRDGVEMHSHSWTHQDASGFDAIHREIVGSKAELERLMPSVKIAGWMRPGATASQYDGWGAETSLSARAPYLAQQLIDATYGAADGDFLIYQALGTRHWTQYSIDDPARADAAAAMITQAADTAMGIVIMVHPNRIGGDGYTSIAKYTEILDHIAALRDAGRIEVLTTTGLTFADPSTGWRHNLAPALSAWSGWGGGDTRTGSTSSGTLYTSVSLSRLGAIKGHVREFAVACSGSGSVTLTVSDQDRAVLERTETVDVSGAGTARMQVGIPNQATALILSIGVSSGDVTVTDARLQAV